MNLMHQMIKSVLRGSQEDIPKDGKVYNWRHADEQGQCHMTETITHIDDKPSKIKQLRIINLEVNTWNGFVFSLLRIETNNFQGELLGLHIGNKHLIFSIAFVHFEVTKPFTW
jgi:hypothetical protein